jgi:hypothetical protein
MNRYRTLVLIVLVLALFACCLPASAILPSFSFRGSVTGVSESDNTVTIKVTHRWGCSYDNGVPTCDWQSITPETLTGSAPDPEVFEYIRIGTSVEAGSIGTKGGTWAGIGILTAPYSSEPLHATRLFGEMSLLRAPLVSGYAVSAATEPDCGDCSGSICTAQAANVTITKGRLMVWDGILLPGEDAAYTDPDDGSGISVTFVSGQAWYHLCPDAEPGITGIQPVSVIIVHVDQGGPGPGPVPTRTSTGSIRVTSIPSGASLFLDGIAKGVTPLTLSSLEPGTYSILLEKEGYADYKKDVSVSAGRSTTLSARLVPLYGSLQIKSSPSNATVLLDGAPAGATPLVIGDLTPGEHTVSISKTGYQPPNRTATVVAGQQKLLFVTLSKKQDGSEKIDAFVAALEKEGFTVQQGKFENFNVLAMYDAGIIPSCFGNNPTTPYLTYKLPAYPGLVWGGRVTDAILNPENKGLWVDYFMNPDEAIVFVGTTPPESKYFSYRSMLGNHWFDEQNTYGRIFASLGDSINNFRIKTGSTPGSISKDPYDKPIMIITTADKGTNEKVRSAATKAGYPTSMMNTDIIPSELIRMGITNTSDTITFIHRVAMFANATRGAEYINGTPGVVFRLTPKSSETLQPYSVPRLIPRGTGDTRELDLMKDQQALKEAIIARHGDGMLVSGKTSEIWVFEGYDAIQREIDALGDSRDTIYLKNGEYPLGDDDFIIVYGANHQATGKVVYTNVAVYGAQALNGVVAVTNKDYAGSADSYLPGNDNADLLYAWKFARHCNGEEGCTEIPSCCGGMGVPEDVPVIIGIRAYIEPETGVGPAWTEILYDQVLHFSPA